MPKSAADSVPSFKGSNERDHKDGPQVTIRDLVLGAELAAST
jgi:histidyl-tRNA synthetase